MVSTQTTWPSLPTTISRKSVTRASRLAAEAGVGGTQPGLDHGLDRLGPQGTVRVGAVQALPGVGKQRKAHDRDPGGGGKAPAAGGLGQAGGTGVGGNPAGPALGLPAGRYQHLHRLERDGQDAVQGDVAGQVLGWPHEGGGDPSNADPEQH